MDVPVMYRLTHFDSLHAPFRFALFTALLLAMTGVAQGKGGDDQARATALLTRAAQQWYPSASTDSFVRHAQVKVQLGLKTADGDYTLAISGPGVWREELTLPNYHEVRVANPPRVLVDRPYPVEPLGPLALFEAMHAFQALQMLPEERATRFEKSKVEGRATQCVELKAVRGSRTICVYADDGSLAALKNAGLIAEFTNYSSTGQWRSPGRIRVKAQGFTVADAEFDSAAVTPTGASLAPGISAELGWCPALMPAALASQVPPHYPVEARENHVMGTVGVYVLISANGRVSEPVPIRSAGPALDRATVEAVRNWTYRPALCGNTAVTSETVVFVNYTLSP